MPSSLSIQAVYDFENILESAINGSFQAAYNGGLFVLTRASVGQFQNQRPRLEVVVKVNGGRPNGNQGASKYLPNLTSLPGIPSNNVTLCAMYSARVQFALVTNGKEDDKLEHSAYLFNARWIIDTLSPRCNYALLANHAINMPIVPGDTSTAFEKEKGYWISNFSAEFTFSILDTAWTQLTN
jgi:hypothetical protein